jgi:serine protease AprX
VRRTLAAAAALTAAAATSFTVAQASATAHSAKIEARLVEQHASQLGAFVVFDHKVTHADVTRLQRLGVVKLHRFDLVPVVAVVTPLKTLDRAAAWPDVVAIRSNDPVRLLTNKSKHAVHVDQVRQPAPKGLGLTGAGVTVADIDSGVDMTHQDFTGRIKTLLNFEGSWIYDNPQDGRFSDRIAEGTGQLAGIDEHGHGSHTAGTIAGTGQSTVTGTDYSGMAPGAQLVIAKIAGGAQGALYDFGYEINCMIAMEYIAEHPSLGVRAINNSWGIYEVDDPRTEPVVMMANALVDRGITMVFAAGNSGPGDNTVGWPGAAGKVITVAATKKIAPFAVSGFSSRGYQVDIAAPGENIYSVRAKTQYSTGHEDLFLSAPGAGADAPFYMAISGTSMATPHITGIVALMYQANKKLTPQVVEEILERTSVDLGDPGKDHQYGYGFVDAYRAAKVALCLKTARNRESCFAAVHALPRSQWASDFGDPGDKSPTDQGSDLPG